MRRLVILLLAGAAVLAVSGCGSSGRTKGETNATGAPARIEQEDVSRLDRAFAGWRRLPPAHKHVCPDTQGGPAAAGASRDYVYPPHQDYGNVPYPYNEVVVSAEYRAPAETARHVAGYARPGELRCTHAAVVRFLHRLTHGSALSRPKKLTRCCGVRITPGLPSRLAGVVGPKARGYREVDNPWFGFPWIYKLAFMYPDRGDPHVTRFVFVSIADRKRIRFPNADSVLRGLALRAIRSGG